MMRAPLSMAAPAVAAVAMAILPAIPARAGVDDGLLPAPPADAKAGQCFARVVVPGEPIYGPPGPPVAHWAPQPGAGGPLWVQICEPGPRPIVGASPERSGWIRVICDHDRTRETISHVQRRLHDWGVYAGGYDGEFDPATAEAVKRFQAERHIEHGGYLSVRTVEALEGAPPAPQVASPGFTPPPAQAIVHAPPEGRRWLTWPGKTAY